MDMEYFANQKLICELLTLNAIEEELENLIADKMKLLRKNEAVPEDSPKRVSLNGEKIIVDLSDLSDTEIAEFIKLLNIDNKSVMPKTVWLNQETAENFIHELQKNLLSNPSKTTAPTKNPIPVEEEQYRDKKYKNLYNAKIEQLVIEKELKAMEGCDDSQPNQKKVTNLIISSIGNKKTLAIAEARKVLLTNSTSPEDHNKALESLQLLQTECPSKISRIEIELGVLAFPGPIPQVSFNKDQTLKIEFDPSFMDVTKKKKALEVLKKTNILKENDDLPNTITLNPTQTENIKALKNSDLSAFRHFDNTATQQPQLTPTTSNIYDLLANWSDKA